MIDALIEIAKRAGDITKQYYGGEFQQQQKVDNTPVTEADLAANAYIVSELKALDGSIPIIAEESDLVDFSLRQQWKSCFLVDPLDGTKEFIKQNGEYTVNIALWNGKRLCYGVIWAPILEELFFFDGEQSFSVIAGIKQRLEICQVRSARVAVSRSHINQRTEQFLSELERKIDVEYFPLGSSLKFCRLAQGKIDIYPRFGPIKEWDIAAGSAILQGAGGKIYNWPEGTEIIFNKSDMLVGDFIAFNPALHNYLQFTS